MERFIFIIFLFFICLTNAVAYVNRFGVSAQIGAVNTDISSANIQPTSTETDKLHGKQNSTAPETSLGTYYTFALSGLPYHSCVLFPAITAALNLRYFEQDPDGDVYQYEDPLLNNYHYQFTVKSLRLMLNAMVTLVTWHEKTSLYLLTGIGNAWNKVGYKDMPNLDVDGGAIKLANKVNSGFVTEVGAGLLYSINYYAAFFLEYRYAHFQQLRTASKGTLDGFPTVISPLQLPFDSQTISFGINWNF